LRFEHPQVISAVFDAVDSSIVLDVLSGGAAKAERSLDAIRKASREGKLIVSESVVAETGANGTDPL
jgi:hypothetical protein